MLLVMTNQKNDAFYIANLEEDKQKYCKLAKSWKSVKNGTKIPWKSAIVIKKSSLILS